MFDIRLQRSMERSCCDTSCASARILRVKGRGAGICPSCTTSTLAWFQFLENLDRLSDLKSSLIALIDERNLPCGPCQYQLVSYRFGNSNFAKFSDTIKGGCDSCSSRCSYMYDELQKLGKDIKAIPPFTDFLKSD